MILDVKTSTGSPSNRTSGVGRFPDRRQLVGLLGMISLSGPGNGHRRCRLFAGSPRALIVLQLTVGGEMRPVRWRPHRHLMQIDRRDLVYWSLLVPFGLTVLVAFAPRPFVRRNSRRVFFLRVQASRQSLISVAGKSKGRLRASCRRRAHRIDWHPLLRCLARYSLQGLRCPRLFPTVPLPRDLGGQPRINRPCSDPFGMQKGGNVGIGRACADRLVNGADTAAEACRQSRFSPERRLILHSFPANLGSGVEGAQRNPLGPDELHQCA